jgi:signal transduction histidine kinase
VQDRGLGIDEADLGKLFTRFGRIVTPENSHISGTGLGLYLARDLAMRHGGDVLVESKKGEGSRFVLSLPGAARPPDDQSGGRTG